MSRPIIDSSFLYALYSASDSRHQQTVAFVKSHPMKVFVPTVILPEVAYLFLRDWGHYGLRQFMTTFTKTSTDLIQCEFIDLQRAEAVMAQYQTAEFDLVDCCIMALAERLNSTKILTWDRRDFSIFRPTHCDYFDLLP